MKKYIYIFSLFIFNYSELIPNLIENKNTNGKFVLITSLYNETNKERTNEYIYCLEKNISHPCIDQIHVVYDTINDDVKNTLLNYLKNKNSIKISYVKGRPSFGYLFEIANNTYNGKTIILSNADIYFEKSLELLLNYDLTSRFLSLTRWEVARNGTLSPNFGWGGHYGADTWIFKSPIEKFKDDSFALGTWGCDGFLIYQAYKSSLTPLNPCKTIKCCHYHQSGIKHYSQDPALVPKNKGMAWIPAGTLQDQKAEVIMLQKETK